MGKSTYARFTEGPIPLEAVEVLAMFLAQGVVVGQGGSEFLKHLTNKTILCLGMRWDLYNQAVALSLLAVIDTFLSCTRNEMLSIPLLVSLHSCYVMSSTMFSSGTHV